MSCVNVQYIDGDECIGASLPKINGNFAALSAAVCSLSANVPDASINVVDSPTIDLNWNSSARTLSTDVKIDSIKYSHLASWQTLSGSPTLSAEAVQPRLAKAWLVGSIGMNSAGATTTYAYNCSLVYVKPGVVRILFHQPFLTENSYVFSWGSAEAGTQHHVIAESVTTDSGLSYIRKNDEIVLGLYREGTSLETASNGRINVVFFGV